MKKLVSSLILALLIYSCKDDILTSITDNAIYSKFEVTYIAETSRTKGKASFWKGSNTESHAIFNEKSSLTFNDNALIYQSGYYYEKEIPGFFQTSIFKVVDVNKKQFLNSIGTSDISLPVIDTVNTSQPWELIWKSNSTALDTGETVTVRFIDQSFTQDSIGVKSITIAASNLSSKKGKTYQVSIERLKTRMLEQSLGGGGSISVLYVARTKTIYFK